MLTAVAGLFSSFHISLTRLALALGRGCYITRRVVRPGFLSSVALTKVRQLHNSGNFGYLVEEKRTAIGGRDLTQPPLPCLPTAYRCEQAADNLWIIMLFSRVDSVVHQDHALKSMCAFQQLINSSPPLAGHDHTRIVAPTTGTDEPSRASPALAAEAATLAPLGNRPFGAVSSRHFGWRSHLRWLRQELRSGIGTCATFGDGGFATTRPQGGCGTG